MQWAEVITGDEARRMQQQPATPPAEQIGTSGKPLSAGRVIGYERARHLQGHEFVRDVGKMLRSSPAAMAAWRLTTSALLSASWSTERPRGASREPEDYLAEAFGVGDWLQRGRCERPFEQLVADLLWYIAFGFGVHEEEYLADADAGVVWLRDLHYREPESIDAWLTDEWERLAGVRQLPVTGWLPGRSWYAVIPANRLLCLSLMRTGANWEGISLLRPCHPHWRDAEDMYRQLIIGAQRWSTATPLVTIDEQALRESGVEAADIVAERDAIAAQAKAYVGHELGYLVVRKGVTIEAYGGEYDPAGVLAAIQHHERSILGTFLAQFLSLGAPGSGGTYNLGAVQEKQAERSLVNLLDGVFGALNGRPRPGGGTVGRLLEWSFPGLSPAEAPRLRFEGLRTRGFLERLEALGTLAAQGLLTRTPATEARLRAALDLPPVDADDPTDGAGAPEPDGDV